MAENALILIVDDNESARYSKSRILRGAGYQILDVGTGAEALRIAREHQPRLIVLDVQLPDIGGWEVCRRIKADDATASIAVLQVSATHVSEADTVRALEGGADASLTEPLEPSVLIATVNALLRARRAEDALREALCREQIARAEAEAANRAKDEFLATLSHELRSPIGTVLTWVTLLRSGKIDAARSVDALAAIERNTRAQVRLIEDLLDVSRIVSGKLRFENTAVDLPAVIDLALDGTREAAQAKGVSLDARVAADIGPIAGDPSRLRQVIDNLLSNAVKFTPAGGAVTLGASRVGSAVEIRISDTGCGIDPRFLPHLFERFRQADPSSTRAQGGLGLGLAIAHHLVELHGGAIRAESPGRDRGSTFTITLPLPADRIEPPPPIGRHVAPAATPLTDAALRGLRILVVDDQRDAREAIAAVLEQCGATVVTASGAREGLALLDERAVDVIVSDIAMPSESGYHLIRNIRAQAPAPIAGIPALALSAFGGLDEERRLHAAGFDHYLGKPVDASELVKAVSALAALRRVPPP